MDLIIDLKDLGRYTHLGFKETAEAISESIEYIITPQILFVNIAISKGYNVYMVNDQKHTNINRLSSLNDNKNPYDLLLDEIISDELVIDLKPTLVDSGAEEIRELRELERLKEKYEVDPQNHTATQKAYRFVEKVIKDKRIEVSDAYVKRIVYKITDNVSIMLSEKDNENENQ